MLRRVKTTLFVIGHEAGGFVDGVGDVCSGAWRQINAFTDDGHNSIGNWNTAYQKFPCKDMIL